ncbi:MAG: GtrA family protein, partial [Solirubrobacterales bacterium]|nr:GtrA family protein [Solirubrobacterales bacterium]
MPGAVAAFLAAVTNNFLWNRAWTFRAAAAHGRTGLQAARFFALSTGGLGVNLAILQLLASELAVPELPSQGVAVAMAMPVNFIGDCLLVRRRQRRRSATATGGGGAVRPAPGRRAAPVRSRHATSSR